MNPNLDIVTVISNPIRWASRPQLARAAIADWLKEPNVRVTLVESAYGSRDHELSDLAADPRINYVPVRNYSLVWSKESLLNIGISRLAPDAKYIGTFDADIHFRKPGWANECVHMLQLHPVGQAWRTAYDLGPNDEHIQTHVSFASLFREGKPVVANGSKFWKFDGGAYEYAHPGFAHLWTRSILDRIGGLFDLGGVGSGDHHMMLSLVGESERSAPVGAHPNYLNALKSWQDRALTHINGNIGFVPGTIEHKFHGSKKLRSYVGRWDMFLQHKFDPYADLKRNSYGVVEFAGNKPELERQWHQYLVSRSEDGNMV